LRLTKEAAGAQGLGLAKERHGDVLVVLLWSSSPLRLF
jgi:hypothetical protein